MAEDSVKSNKRPKMIRAIIKRFPTPSAGAIAFHIHPTACAMVRLTSLFRLRHRSSVLYRNIFSLDDDCYSDYLPNTNVNRRQQTYRSEDARPHSSEASVLGESNFLVTPAKC